MPARLPRNLRRLVWWAGAYTVASAVGAGVIMWIAILYHAAGGGRRPMDDLSANPWALFTGTVMLLGVFAYSVFIARGYSQPREARVRYLLVGAQLFAIYIVAMQAVASYGAMR